MFWDLVIGINNATRWAIYQKEKTPGQKWEGRSVCWPSSAHWPPWPLGRSHLISLGLSFAGALTTALPSPWKTRAYPQGIFNAKGLLKPIHGPQVKTARSTDPWGLSAQKTILKLTWLCNTCLQWRRQESWPSERNSSVPMDSVFWFSTMNIYWAPFACEALGQIAVCADEQGMYPVS